MLQPDNYLKLSIDSTDTGANPQIVTTHGNVSYGTVNGRSGAYFSDRSLNSYLSYKCTNTTQITIGFWMFAKDNGDWSPMSITKTPLPFVWASPIFVPVLNNKRIIFLAQLPSKWTVSYTYNYDYAGKWTHICYVLDNTNYNTQLYVNGNYVASGKGTGKCSAANLYVIGKAGDDYRPFYGYISDFFVFNRILSASDIKNIYQGNMFSSPGYQVGLQYYGYFNNRGFNNYNSATNFSIFSTKSQTSGLITMINNSNNTPLLYQTYGFSGNQYIALKFSGYFVPNVTGKWGFIMGSTSTNLPNDDLSYLWIGDNALNPTPSNYSGMCYYYSNMSQAYVYMNLTAGTYYPLLMYWGQSWGGFVLSLGIVLPNGTKTYDGSEYFKYADIPKLENSNFGKEYFSNMIEEEKIVRKIVYKDNKDNNILKIVFIVLVIIIIFYLIYKYLPQGKKK